MPLGEKRREPESPGADEWGMYDPERTGLAALREHIEDKRRASPPPLTFGIACLIYYPDTPEPAPEKDPRDDE